MARFYPPRPDPDTPRSELDTWRALESLPHSWRVFHSVAWQVPKQRRVFDGEADFVLLHPKHGMVVLEVKGGLLDVRDGVWHQRNVSGGPWHELTRSPFDQAKGAMYDLQRYLATAVPGLGEIPATRGVVLPAASHPGSLGPDAPTEMLFAQADLADLRVGVERLVSYARLEADLSTDHIGAITDLFAPTVTIRRTIGSELDDVDRRLLELTSGQIRVLDLLRRHRRALITGGAGTGKTVLAVERARRLATEGASVLLTCYNRPLGDHLATVTADMPGVRAQSFHAFARWLFGEAGLELPASPTQEWWDVELPELLFVAKDQLGVAYDAVVVDEGQDFRPIWFMGLQMLLEDPDDGPFYVFADPLQSIYVDGWESPIDGDPFPLDVNCRNTVQIAEKVAAVVGAEAVSLGVEGLSPQFVVADTPEQKRAVLEEVVRRLVDDEGVDPDRITILGSHRRPIDEGKGQEIAGHRVGSLGDPGLVAETIHRFKGLEDDVVIVFLDEVENDRHRALAYVGMSRARALLIVVGSKEVRSAIGW